LSNIKEEVMNKKRIIRMNKKRKEDLNEKKEGRTRGTKKTYTR
jgi:hypothetical protein